jgi:hypothetical protein
VRRPLPCRETVVCRRSTSEPPFDAENRRELASRIYDEYPCRSGIFDTVLFGYAPVSTAEQNPDHQIAALIRAGVAAEDIHVDHASGAKASRPELDALLRMLRDGDTLKITRLDRPGRSVLHLVTLGAELRERGVGLHVTEQGIDTTTAEGRAMFGMLSVLAELQRELILANTRDGLSARALAVAGAAAGPGSTPSRSPSHKSSTTPATTPSGRSPTSSACPAPPSTGTSRTQARASVRPFIANRTAPPTERSQASAGQRKWRLVTRFLPAPLIADVVGQLDLHRALHQPPGQLGEQPAGPGDLLLRARAGKQLVDHLIADPTIRRQPESLTEPAAAGRPVDGLIDELGRHDRGVRGVVLQLGPGPALRGPASRSSRHSDLFRYAYTVPLGQSR